MRQTVSTPMPLRPPNAMLPGRPPAIVGASPPGAACWSIWVCWPTIRAPTHLLQAVAVLVAQGHNVHLLLGGYPHIEQYRQMAQGLGIAERVTLAGRICYEDAPAFLGLGDIAMAPKLSATEGAGKILNYMAVGLPVVAYDTAASREYLGNWGVYAERGNALALAAETAGLLASPERQRAITAALRRRAVEQYGWDHTGQTILGTYSALLGLQPQSSRSA